MVATDDSYCPPATTCRDVLDRCGAVLVRPASAELVMRAWQVAPTFPGCLSVAGGGWWAGGGGWGARLGRSGAGRALGPAGSRGGTNRWPARAGGGAVRG